jgi:hypothetical protein
MKKESLYDLLPNDHDPSMRLFTEIVLVTPAIGAMIVHDPSLLTFGFITTLCAYGLQRNHKRVDKFINENFGCDRSAHE